MTITIKKVVALENHIHPTLCFHLDVPFTNNQEAIVSVSGWLMTKDEKVLAQLVELDSEREEKLMAENYLRDNRQFSSLNYASELIAPLDPKALSLVEDCRRKEPKNGVELMLEVIVKKIRSRTYMATLEIGNAVQQQVKTADDAVDKAARVNPVYYTQNTDYKPAKDNLWVLSGYSFYDFMDFKVSRNKISYRISMEDWITEYAHKLDLGARILLEVKLDGEISKRAKEYLDNAENAFRRGDSKSAYVNCRELGTHLDSEVKKKYGADSFVYKDKWGRAYAHYSTLASLDVHIEDIRRGRPDDNLTVSSSDVEYLLLEAKNLTRYALNLGDGLLTK